MNGHDRRDFLKAITAGAVAAGVPAWAYARPINTDQEPAPPVRDPRYREWSNVALAEAKRLGCSYADIRFTRNRAQSLTLRNGQIFAGGGRFGGDGFGGRGGGGTTETYGFGVRVIHNGVWGFSSSPVVTPDEIKRVTGIATEIARASAVAKKTDVRLAPVEKYDEYWQMPFEKDPWTVPLEEKVELLRSVTSAIQKAPGILFATATAGFEYEWKYLATSEGSYIEQLFRFCNCSASATARTGSQVKTRNYDQAARRRLRVPHQVRPPWQCRAHRRRSHRALEGQARRPGSQGSDPAAVAPGADDSRDRRASDRARSHRRLRSELRRHELHQDRGHRQAEVRLAEVQHHRRPHVPRRHGNGWVRRRRREVAEVADRQGRHPRGAADQS